jgi:anti-sigma B factor antagonist
MIIGTKTRRVEPDITVVEISGHLNLGNNLAEIERLLKRLIDEGVRKLAVDLANLNFIDSAGIGMLVATNGHMDTAGGKIRLAGAHGPVAKVFDVVHMDRIIPLDGEVSVSLGLLSASEAAG